MRVALCQIDTILGDIDANFTKINRYIDKAVYEKCDMVVFPELSLTGYNLRDLVVSLGLNDSSDKIKDLKEKSRDIDIIFGYVEENQGFFYNSALYLSNNDIKHNHRKKYLPDYGMFEEGRYFNRGASIDTIKTKFGNMTLFICEDSFHISSQNIAYLNKTDILIILSASPFWMDSKSIKPDLWQSICSNFTQLSGSYAIYVNRVGFEDGIGFFGGSFVMNPFGEIADKADLFREELIIVDFDENSAKKAKSIMPIMKNED